MSNYFLENHVNLSSVDIKHNVLSCSVLDKKNIPQLLYVPLYESQINWKKVPKSCKVIDFYGSILILSNLKIDKDFTSFEKSEFLDPDRNGHRQLVNYTVTPNCTGLISGFDRNGNFHKSLNFHFKEPKNKIRIIQRPLNS